MPRPQSTSIYLLALLLALFGAGCSEKAKDKPVSKIVEPTEPADPVKEAFYEYCAATNRAARTEAKLALQELSSNSVPFLVNACFHPEVNGWLLKHQPPLDMDATNIASRADQLISDLHPPATLLLPLLTNVLSDSSHSNYCAAIYFLGRIGEGNERGLPYLQTALTNLASDKRTRTMAAQSLRFLGSNAIPALPTMIEALKQTNSPRNLLYTLGELGPAAEAALPMLVDRWISTGKTNDYLYEIICKVDTNRLAEAVRDLTKTIKGTNNVGPGIQKLLRLSHDDGIAALRSKMHMKPTHIAVWAASWLLLEKRDDAEASLFLQNFLENRRHDSAYDQSIMEGLAAVSPTNQQVIALLEPYTKDSRPDVSKAAEKSLAQIRRN